MVGMDMVCHDLPLVDPCFFPPGKVEHIDLSMPVGHSLQGSLRRSITGSPATFFGGGKKTSLGFFLFGNIEVNNKTHPRFGTYHLLKTKCRGDNCCDINPRGGFLRWYFDPYNIGSVIQPPTNKHDFPPEQGLYLDPRRNQNQLLELQP